MKMSLAGMTGIAAALFAIASSNAAMLTWDTNTTDGVASDGSGIWDAVNTNWFDGTVNTNWRDANPDFAIFGATNGAAGTVTVTNTRTIGGITFNSPGSGTYTITGGTLLEKR